MNSQEIHMTVDEMLSEVITLLQKEGRVSYRLLKRRFALDDDYIADLKVELIKAKRLAVDEDGEVLVWVGDQGKGETAKRRKGETGEDSELRTLNSELFPVSYTPQHLAERIRAEQAAMEARGATDGERKILSRIAIGSSQKRCWLPSPGTTMPDSANTSSTVM